MTFPETKSERLTKEEAIAADLIVKAFKKGLIAPEIERMNELERMIVAALEGNRGTR